MKTWPIYLRYQSEFAYGGGLGSLSHTAPLHHEHARSHLEPGRILFLGPGGPAEISSVGGQGMTIHALTAFGPEAELIRKNLPDVQVDVGDMHEMPYESGVFDQLYASNVLEHAIAPYAALMQCRRVLRYGGTAFFVLPWFEGKEGGRGPFHLHCLTAEVWGELLRKTGLVVTRVDRIRGGEDPTGGYHEFRCTAADPPNPHDRVLAELRAWHAGNP